ncbi:MULTISPECIES: lytic transglycosylase domain-containing protein [Streptomyces]|uniref:Secreted protein n=4 Tax=Streptomyces venezuelae TaxID=54571 RepID=F2RGV4_STRVP|nr:lytic transglycosylase domain-containing protein [Streptomyces venezuelae]APE20956.1 lytic transglycosylase [Streptomyces venezuelae]QER98352.1 lytic transglycosylase [Streptomyces venezuelae ATCC 10712]CCA54915.1 secreted protein [Streptomyces venezuelae ATCC 10712]
MSAHLGRRLRRGATSGAVVAAAVAALAASQAPETTAPPTDNAGGDRAVGAGDTASPSGEDSATGDSPYYTDLPPLNTPNKPGAPTQLPVITGPAEAGIPASVLAAYKRAEQSIRSTDPGCNLPWQLLAGIGKVESGQARGGAVDANGTTLKPILGPVLDGVGFANISDTDRGAYDGDTTHDRAVGPMQFIPSTWATWGQDANSDGKKDPNNIYDAAQAAGLYLCANDRNLALKADLDRAILSYNRSTEYLNTVTSWFEFYRRGSHQVPDGTGVLPVDRSDGRGQGNRPSSPFPPAPTTPAPKPSGTGQPKPNPSKPGGPSEVTPPPTKPSKPPVTPPTKPPTVPPAARVARLAPVSTGQLTATTGRDFAKSPSVAALDAAGAPVAGVSVRYEITGTTDARFAGGATTATVTSGSAGIAAAPVLRAGEKTGTFTVKATVVGRGLDAAEFTATVTERPADKLARVGGDPLSADTGTTFAQPVQVKATDKGALAPGVRVTAMVVASASDTEASAEGPYFKDASGNALRTLVLTTDENGLISLPALLAGDKAGEYVLRLTAPGGGSAEIKLTVTAPATTTPEPAPSGSGSPEASPSPSA